MKNGKVIWAVNPFREDKKTRNKAQLLVTEVVRRTGWTVQPTFVADPAEIRITLETASVDKHPIVRFAEERLRNSLPPKWRASARILFQKELSVSASAIALSREAHKQRAALTLVSTRAKGGIGLFGMGSFTQALVSNSLVPVLSINPARYKPSHVRRILFATDFSKESRKALRKLSELARALKCEVIICHIYLYPAYWVVDPMLFQPAALPLVDERFMRETRADLEKRCEKLAAEVRGQGVKASVAVRESISNSVPGGILHEASKSRADMIALACQSGKFVRGVLGTTTQRLVHDSPLPVWTYRA